MRSASEWRLHTLTRPDVQSSTWLCFCHPTDCRSSCCCKWTSSSFRAQWEFQQAPEISGVTHTRRKYRPGAAAKSNYGCKRCGCQSQNFLNRTSNNSRGSVWIFCGIKWLKLKTVLQLRTTNSDTFRFRILELWMLSSLAMMLAPATSLPPYQPRATALYLQGAGLFWWE